MGSFVQNPNKLAAMAGGLFGKLDLKSKSVSTST
jgi:hypothetical protein